MRFEPVVGWGTLPAGWRYVEVAGVAVDAKDNVFCFTRGEHPVIVFDRDGKFLRSWGEGQIRRAHGISLDAEGMLWLTDDLHHTSRKFTPEGKLLLTPGGPALQPAHPRRRLPANRQSVSLRRLRELPRPQVRARRPASAVVGRARHRSRAVQSPSQSHYRPERARLRGRPREPPGADLRRQRPFRAGFESGESLNRWASSARRSR